MQMDRDPALGRTSLSSQVLGGRCVGVPGHTGIKALPGIQAQHPPSDLASNRFIRLKNGSRDWQVFLN